jgi:hypothetical protein
MLSYEQQVRKLLSEIGEDYRSGEMELLEHYDTDKQKISFLMNGIRDNRAEWSGGPDSAANIVQSVLRKVDIKLLDELLKKTGTTY